MKNKRTFALLLFILGTAALVVGIISLHNQNTYVKTTATVTGVREELDMSEEHTDYDYVYTFKYEVDGTEYEAELTYESEDFKEGDTIEIMYNPDKPTSVTTPGKGFSIYLIILGPVLMFGGIFAFLKS